MTVIIYLPKGNAKVYRDADATSLMYDRSNMSVSFINNVGEEISSIGLPYTVVRSEQERASIAQKEGYKRL